MTTITPLKPDTKVNTISRVFNVVAEQADVLKKGLTIETTLVELHLDSLDRVELIMGLEEEFHIEISDEQAEAAQLKSVSDLVQFVTNFDVTREVVPAPVPKPEPVSIETQAKRIKDLEEALRMMLEVTDEWKQTDNAFAYGRLVLNNDPRIGKTA